MKLWTIDRNFEPAEQSTTLAELSSGGFYLGEARREAVARHGGRNIYLDGLMRGYAFLSEEALEAFLQERNEGDAPGEGNPGQWR